MASKFIGNFMGEDIALDDVVNADAISLIEYQRVALEEAKKDREYANLWRIQELVRLRDEARQSSWYQDVMKNIKNKLRVVK